VLAYNVTTGRVPLQSEKRWHNRSAETPVLIDVLDWTNDRRICSVLVWPSLESEPQAAELDHFERVQQVKQVLAKGATEQALSTRFDVDWGLSWSHERKCWVAQDGYAYDGLRETDIRSGQDREPDQGHNGAVFLSLGRPMPEENEEGS
jgi:hypothetical protein